MVVVGRSNVLLRGSCERLWLRKFVVVVGGGGDGRSKVLCVGQFSRPLKQIEFYSRFAVVEIY